jgi:hypothetical protein
MIPQDLALRFALLKVLVAELAGAKRVADCEIRDEWRPSDRLTATIPAGKDIGTVTLAKGKTTASVTDLAAYEAWAAKAHPEWIETATITRVNLDATMRLLAAARKLGVAVDAETGEVVPGIAVNEGDPYPMVKLADDARDVVARAWHKGQLTELVGGLLAIDAEIVEGGE